MKEDQAGKAKVIEFRLTAGKAQELVRARAADSDNIIWTKHARERMIERGIDASDVLNILRKGSVEEAPTEGRNPNEVKLKVTRLTGGREAGVVVVLASDNKKIKLLTAEWEDVK